MPSKPYTRFFGNLTNADYKLQSMLELTKLFEKIIEERRLKLAEEEHYDENPELFGKESFFTETYIRTLRYSIIINLITFLEIELHSYCTELRKSLDIKIKHTEIKGNILEQFKAFTNKVCALGIEFGTQNWKRLKELTELRNCIVHYDGQVEDWYGRKFSRVELIERLGTKFEFVRILENQFIELNEDAGVESISIVQEFISYIYEVSLKTFPK